MIKTMGKVIVGEDRSFLPYRILECVKSIIIISQGSYSSKGGTWRQELKERHGRMCLLAYTTCLRQLAFFGPEPPTHEWYHPWLAEPITSIINQVDVPTSAGSSDGEMFLIEVPFFYMTISYIKMMKTTEYKYKIMVLFTVYQQ